MYAVFKLLSFERDIVTLDGRTLDVINNETKHFIPVFERLKDAEESSCNGRYEIMELQVGKS